MAFTIGTRVRWWLSLTYYKNDPVPGRDKEKPWVEGTERQGRLKRDCLEGPVFFLKVRKNVKLSHRYVSCWCGLLGSASWGGANSTLFLFPFKLILDLGGSWEVNPSVSLTWLPLLLTSYITTENSKPRNCSCSSVLTKICILFEFLPVFYFFFNPFSESCPGSHVTFSYYSLVSKMWQFITPSLCSMIWMPVSYFVEYPSHCF